MRLYGLVGFPLGHSFSERYFADKFRKEGIADAVYHNFPLEKVTDLENLLSQNPSLSGFNVTIPYKEAVIPYLTSVNDEAARIGAVNCVKVTNGGLIGYNTDATGFRASLLESLDGRRPSSALILGTGGASKAVAYVLGQLGITYRFVSRTAAEDRISYSQLTGDIISGSHLIINTTPLGTFPKTDECPPIHYDAIGPEHLLFDLVYNPPQTKFMALGQSNGAKTVNGYRMLVGQAEEAWRIWNE